ncbi:MAG: translation elongation factor Ts [Chloroflexota bacterium]
MAIENLASKVKQLREMTGAGPLDCKKALEETNGDLDAAAEILRQKGIAAAVKKQGKDRTMNEGLVEIYSHHDGRLGAMVEVNCETDFVARNEIFQQFAKDIALHISSMAPQYVKRDDVPAEVIEAQREAQLAMDDLEGKPDNIKEKIVEGRVDKWLKSVVLMEQEFLKDDSKTINDLLLEVGGEIGEKIQIGRFSRFVLGDYGDEDETDDED